MTGCKINLYRDKLDKEYDSWADYQVIHEFNSKGYKEMKKIVICDCDGILTDGNQVQFAARHTTSGGYKGAKIFGSHDKEIASLFTRLCWDILFVTNDSDGKDITKSRITQSIPQAKFKFAGPSERAKIVREYVDKGYVVVFCGDSPSDLAATREADYACTTQNCFTPIKNYFNYVSEHDGGHGGFAEILWWVLDETYRKYKLKSIGY